MLLTTIGAISAVTGYFLFGYNKAKNNGCTASVILIISGLCTYIFS